LGSGCVELAVLESVRAKRIERGFVRKLELVNLSEVVEANG
jgi:hypothetical protein